MPEPRLIDGRDMQPPEPLERALAELATLAPGEELVMLLRCEPLPLYSILEKNGFGYRSQLRPDGTNEVRIQKVEVLSPGGAVP
jgi:uncharacterized protein (DUF2249 family)